MATKAQRDMAEQTRRPKSALARWMPIIVLALGIALVFVSGAHRYLSPAFLVEHYAELTAYVAQHYFLAMAAFCLIYILAAAFSIPGALILTIAGGLFFGAIAGGIAIVFSATIGASLIFLAARTSLGEALRERAGPMVGRLRKGFQENAVSYLLFLRLVPAFPFWVVNLAPAMFGVPLHIYVLTTFFGIIPGTFAYSFVGAGIDGIVAAQARELEACRAAGNGTCEVSLSVSDLVNQDLLIAFAALGVIALLPALLKRFRKSQGAGKV